MASSTNRAALQLLLQLKGDAQAQKALKGMQGMIKGVGQAAKNAGGLLTTALGSALGFVAGQAVGAAVRGLGNMARTVRSAALDMNATLETTGLQFETLMGDADKARAHVEGLFDFAKETPFETEPIIEASKQLQAYGREALNTRENLTLIGDAAAALNAPIDELGRWTGRLYSALQMGKPFGEAAMRLQELAVLSPEARAEMERLQAVGADAGEVWAVFTADLARFTGSMGKQANTWKGLTSTISDSAKLLSATAFKPLFDLVKRGAKTIVDMLSSEGAERAAQRVAAAFQWLIDRVRQSVRIWMDGLGRMDMSAAQTAGHIAGFFFGLAKQAVSWGFNIVDSLSVGILGALELVSRALGALGRMISGWLKPGSPPKLLPNLDEWGTEAAEVWLAGWTEADFGALREFGQVARDAIQAIGGEDVEGASLVRVSQGFAALLEQVRRTGHASVELFAEIREAAGAAGPEIEALARRYARVAEVSGRLAQVQRELAGVEAEQRGRLDQMRLSELEAILADPRATPGQRERATMEARQIRLLMEERDLQAELDEAQGELEHYRSRLDVETETLALLAQQRDTLGAVADTAAELKGSLGAAGELADGLGEAFQKGAAALDELEGFDLSAITGVLDEIREGFEEGEQAAADFAEVVTGIVLPDWLRKLLGLEEEERQLPIRFLQEEGQWSPKTQAEELGLLTQAMADFSTQVTTTQREQLDGLPGKFGDLGREVVYLKLKIDEVLPSLGVEGGLSGELGILDGLLGGDAEGVIGKITELAGKFTTFFTPTNILTLYVEGLTKAVSGLNDAIGWVVEKIQWLMDHGGIQGLAGQAAGDLADILGIETATPGPHVPGTGALPPQAHAGGSAYYEGGWSLVGERGAELVRLPRGSRIYPAGESAMMLGGGAQPVRDIHFHGDIHVRDREDIPRLAYELAKEIRRQSL
jgi:hypothetical protein